MLAASICLSGLILVACKPAEAQKPSPTQPISTQDFSKPLAALPEKSSAENYFLDQIEQDKKRKATAEQIRHLCLLGQFYSNNGDKAKSESTLKEALTLAEKGPASNKAVYAESLLSLARYHLSNGFFDKAKAEYNNVIKSYLPDVPAATQLRANLELQAVLIYTGSYKEAAAMNARTAPLIKRLSADQTVLKANAMDQSGEVEYLLGHYKIAENDMKDALAILAANKTPHPLDLAVVQNDLGAVYSDMGNYELAEKFLNLSLAGKTQIVGEDNALTARSLSNLAKLESKRGNLDQAEKFLVDAIKARKSDSGIKALAYARSLCDLGEVKRLQNKLDDSEKPLTESLEIYKKQFGSLSHPDAATASNNLAMLQADRGHLDDAEKLLKQALDIKQKTLGNTHPDCAIVLNNLAYVEEKKQQFAEADKLYLQAQQITTAALGAEHPSLATILNNRSLVAESLNKNADAEKLQLQAIAIRRKFAKLRSADLVSSLNNLGELYMAEGKFQKATPLLQEAEKASANPKFPDKRLRATLLGNLALLADRRQDYPAAEKYYKDAQTATETSYGKSSIEYARALSNFAGLYRAEHKLKEAAPLQQESLSIREKCSGPDSLDAAREYNNLGELYLAQNKLSDAETMLNRAQKVRTAKLGETHKDVAVTLCALGKLRLAQKRLPEAEQLLKQAEQIQVKALAANDEKLYTAKGAKDQATKMKLAGEQIRQNARAEFASK